MELFFCNISKSYSYNLALYNFTVSLQPGIYALLGPNGSGKSTLMNIITDNLKADSGEITYTSDDGVTENVLKMGVRFREKLGFMPQYPGLYPNFTVFSLMSGPIVVGDEVLNKEKAPQIHRQIQAPPHMGVVLDEGLDGLHENPPDFNNFP